MANTLDGLYPVLYDALDTISRELVGFIPAVSRDTDAAQAAKDQTVRSPIVPTISGEDITPGESPADSGDQNIGYVDITISKSRAFPVRWNGEEQVSIRTSGQMQDIMRRQFTQALRAAVNEVEADIAALYVRASRAYGTAGTAPFGTANDFSDFAQIRKILEDNGAPMSDLQLVLGSAAAANLRSKFTNLLAVSEAGTDEMLRRGALGQVEGLLLRQSAGVKTHSAGAGANYDVDLGGGYSVGDTDIHVDTGTGAILAGDVIEFSGHEDKYVVATGATGGGDQDITLAAPGLVSSVANDEDVTLSANYAANMAFDRGAIVLATRAPAMPEGGDEADDVTTITDPVTGLSFQVAAYRQYRQVKYEVGLAWGVQLVKPEHAAILLG